jgi:deoxyribonuclease IV
MKLGAHQSIAGGILCALESITEIGGNCLQIFSSSPRRWSPANISDNTINKFVVRKKELNISPLVFHACYLINLADAKEVGEKSIVSLSSELKLAEKLGSIGSIVHTGSFKKKEKREYDFKTIDKREYGILIHNIGRVLDKTPENTCLILENSATNKIGSTLDELEQIINDTQNKRLRVCLDICHLHASSYDITTREKLEKFIEEFESRIGLEKLEVIHLNDSKDHPGSFRDRHENIGEGQIGINVFKNLLNHPALRNKPFIIETPGFDGKGPDKKNLDILKSLKAIF